MKLPNLPEVDGLRAIAVMAVVLNHLGVDGFHGGYVGVDVFFVISGFLITNIIKTEVEETGSFNYSRFYVKRFRRLFPAFFVVALASFGVAFSVFGPRHFTEFCASIAAAVASVSNIFFWVQVRYFDTASTLKPMLHTWSLSVEEQFYLVWPATVAFMVRSKIRPLLFLGLLGVVSLSLNELFRGGWTHHFLVSVSGGAINADGLSTIFYLMPFRIFEFAIGAAIAWMPIRGRTTGPTAEVLSSVGLFMIAYSIFSFTPTTVFPSFNALIPCIGTALLIVAGNARHLGYVVRNPVSLFLGKISYSVYLVHWPLIVFATYITMDDLNGLDKVWIIAATLVLASLLYYSVENPFRKGTRHKLYLTGMATCALALSAASFHAWYNGGWMWRYADNVAAQLSPYREDAINNFVHALKNSSNAQFDNDGRPKVMVVGDSMTGDFMNLLHAASIDRSLDLKSYPMPYPCLPAPVAADDVITSAVPKYADLCIKEAAGFNNAVIDRHPETVVLAAMWSDWWVPEMEKTIGFLKQAGVKTIVIVGRKSISVNGQQFLAQNALHPRISSIDVSRQPAAVELNNIISDHANASGVYFVDAYSLVCPEGRCEIVADNKDMYYWDTEHLTPEGVLHFSSGFKALWEKIEGRKDLALHH
ncbi:acyltransferase family protein [Rhizobiales bacterium RZME27]|uniref:Acyltransferase family protein n=1 Tax=Endobacterium cereale TaxID=2663029 RepID=A0A6A8AA69_9HYPH|nr:acyltransferase family protein [Endobacterium cereale]MQY48183.1 acyltransferase family protein [Endobacterium cereale]